MTITYEFACKALMSIGSEQRTVRLAEILFEPLAPVEHWRFGAVASSHLNRH